MKIYRKQTILLFLIALITISCADEDNTSDVYFLRAKFNNESVNFPTRFAGSMQENGMGVYFFTGLSNLNNGTPSFSIALQTNETFSADTYVIGSDILSAEYIISEGQSSYEANNDIDPKDFTLVITSINNNTVEGTFYGVLKSPEGQTIVVSEGSFLLPWQVQ